MRNDQCKVMQLLDSSKVISYKDVNMLKLILCSGLYPQFAIPDEFNFAKGSGSDQLFHTKVKPFNLLHPNSIFCSNPEYLEVQDIDKVFVSGYKNHKSIRSAPNIKSWSTCLCGDQQTICGEFHPNASPSSAPAFLSFH